MAIEINSSKSNYDIIYGSNIFGVIYLPPWGPLVLHNLILNYFHTDDGN